MRPLVVLLCLQLAAAPALARPDGADWLAVGGPGRADCTSCHFDGEALRQDARLTLKGLPARLAPGKSYDLELVLTAEGLANAGCLVRAEAGGDPAGAFEAADERTEANGAALRSTLAGSTPASAGEARWRFRWTAPKDLSAPVIFHVAANAGDNDQSPFGDQVYLSSFSARP